MFGSYAIVFGRGEHRRRLREHAYAHGLSIHEQPDLLLVAQPETAVLTSDNAVLVGQLFSNANRPVEALTVALDRCATATDLREALRGHWGNFSLFSASPERYQVYRDPSGSVPVFRCGDGGRAVFVSDAEIADRLRLVDDSEADARFAVHWLQFPFLRTRRTGVADVVEILPGMCAGTDRSDAWTERLLWRPLDFVGKGSAIWNPEGAARALRELATAVVAAQPGARRTLLELSGGLDSSIIAACLARSGREVSCVNFATRSVDGDERDHARAVAAAFQFSLTEILEGEPGALERDARRSFRPGTNPILGPIERAVGDAARALGADLVIDGAGGDNLFCSVTTASPVLDAWRWSGPGAATRAMTNIAQRAGCTWWDVARAAAARAFKRRPTWKEDGSFLRPNLLFARPEVHPWLNGLHRAAPGKREHVEALVHIQHFLDRGSAGVARLHPLMAQPLLEICLRIPSWLWMDGGRDRAIARDAFAGVLPDSILARRAKGSLQSLFDRSFARFRPSLHELLRAGELQRRGIIDVDALDAALSGPDRTPGEIQLRISEMAALELWLQSWRANAAGRTTPA